MALNSSRVLMGPIRRQGPVGRPWESRTFSKWTVHPSYSVEAPARRVPSGRRTEVGHRRAGGVTGDVPPGDVADAFKDGKFAAVFTVAIPQGVLGIDHEIQAAVGVPVDEGELPAAAAAARPRVEPQRLSVFVDEDPPRRPTAGAQDQVALLVEGDEVELAVRAAYPPGMGSLRGLEEIAQSPFEVLMDPGHNGIVLADKCITQAPYNHPTVHPAHRTIPPRCIGPSPP